MQNAEAEVMSNNTKSSVFHPATSQDQAAMRAMRPMMESNKGRMRGAAARVPYDDIMNRVPAPTGVAYEAGSVGGISGWWCRPEHSQPDEVILHLHGGWFNFGSAQAFRHLVGQIAGATSVGAFIPDYRLAPEHPFPAAMQDAETCFGGLVALGYSRIAVTGDSAGGCLALLLLSLLQAQAASKSTSLPVGAVALSPVTDLALTGDSWTSRAEADPFFTKPQATDLVAAYLAGHDPADPAVSPLYGDLQNLPPIRIHVGDDEVLLDDSRRYVDHAVAAEVDARVDVWECMAHGFLSGIGKLDASAQALQQIAGFLQERLSATKS